MIGVERGSALEDADGRLSYLDPLWATGQLRMNEGACDPDGRFYCGSMGYQHQRGADALYRLDPRPFDTRGARPRHRFQRPRLAPGRHPRLLYRHRDAPHRRVRLRPGRGLDGPAPVRRGPRGGRPSRRPRRRCGRRRLDRRQPRRCAATPPPASWTRWSRWRPGRSLRARSVAPRLDELFITTPREDLEPGDDPLAGSLFHVVPGVRASRYANSRGDAGTGPLHRVHRSGTGPRRHRVRRGCPGRRPRRPGRPRLGRDSRGRSRV